VDQFTGKTVDDTSGVLGFGDGEVEVGPSTVVSTLGTNEICEKTNYKGLAAIEVKNSTLKHVDLNVEYVEENILRDHEVSFVTPAEEKAEKEKKEAEEKAAKEKKEAEEKAAKEKKEAEEKAKVEKEKKEAVEKEVAEKAAAEKAANEAKEKAANEQREKEVEAAAKKAAVTPAAAITSGAAPLYTPIAGVSGVSSSVKPLTAAQKLANALKACKKLPKSKRAACEAKAKRAYSAKKKKK